MRVQPLQLPLRSYPVHSHSLQVVDLGRAAQSAGDGDFLRLRLKVRYSPWWKLRKPALLMLEVEHADGIYDSKAFLVEPNVSSEVWFYPGDEAELARYFNGDAKQWRPDVRSPVEGLRVLVMPFDWVSIQPQSVELEAADVISFDMSP
jgi:hypothetical protein